MSKKTRKKSPKSAGKCSSEKTGECSLTKNREGARLENGQVGRRQASQRRGRGFQKNLSQSIAEGAVETVKAGGRQPAEIPDWPKARAHPPFGCRGMAVIRFRWRTLPGKSSSFSSTRAPTRRAAPSRRSILPA